jgi:hypothetical protein
MLPTYQTAALANSLSAPAYVVACHHSITLTSAKYMFQKVDFREQGQYLRQSAGHTAMRSAVAGRPWWFCSGSAENPRYVQSTSEVLQYISKKTEGMIVEKGLEGSIRAC